MFHKIVKMNQYSSTSTKLIEKKTPKIKQSKMQLVKRVILYLLFYTWMCLRLLILLRELDLAPAQRILH